MTDPKSDPDEAAIDDEIARYRRAAEATIDQLDWCVRCLYGIRKPRIAEVIAKNRATIRRRMSAAE
jgi:hypothetical protein